MIIGIVWLGGPGADLITLFDASKFKTRFACELKNYDPLVYLDKKEARKLDRFAQTAIGVSDQAWRMRESQKKM